MADGVDDPGPRHLEEGRVDLVGQPQEGRSDESAHGRPLVDHPLGGEAAGDVELRLGGP